MSKRITVGPIEHVVKDFGNVYDFYFDQNFFVETEIKTFLKEYETKRGDRDIIALQNQTIMANATMNTIKQCQQQSTKLDPINETLRQLNDKIQNQVLREDVYQSHRDSDRIVKFDELELEKSQVEEQLNAKKAVIDKEFNDAANALRDKYQIVL